jgi:cell division septation protein DedD
MKHDDTASAADEAFHEIQLSGKQLVFLCMATTVVSVLIFLCGVLVGRGVRAEKGEPLMQESVAEAAADPAAAQAPEASGASGDPAPPEGEKLTFPDRLQGKPTEEALKPESAPAPAAQPPAPAAPPPAPPEEAAPEPPARRDGFSVQVAALRDRAEADAIVKRLAAKGYPAYVVEPPPNAPAAVYRVRIGGYPDRREAESIVRRLEKEEQFKPWITR